jgi:hypothetical protein
LRFGPRRPVSACGYLGVNVRLYLCLDHFMLGRSSGFVSSQLIIFHPKPSCASKLLSRERTLL